MTPGVVTAERRGNWVTACITNPDRANALSIEMWEQIVGIVQAACGSDGISGVLVTSDPASEAFCSGADLADVTRWRQGDDDRLPHVVVTAMRELATAPILTVAHVRGPAVGGGAGLALACDRILCGPRATFRLPQRVQGVVPDRLLVRLLVARTNLAMARELLLTGRTVNADDACRYGLADAHVPDSIEAVQDQLEQLDGPGASDSLWVRASKGLFASELGLDEPVDRLVDTFQFSSMTKV